MTSNLLDIVFSIANVRDHVLKFKLKCCQLNTCTNKLFAIHFICFKYPRCFAILSGIQVVENFVFYEIFFLQQKSVSGHL